MTQREFFTAIINGEYTDEVAAMAQVLRDKLDDANAKKRAKAAEKAAEKAPVKAAIYECLTAEPKTATMLIAETGLDISVKAVPALLKSYVDEGAVVKEQVKVDGKNKQVGYKLA